jgi:hypothetical protein
LLRRAAATASLSATPSAGSFDHPSRIKNGSSGFRVGRSQDPTPQHEARGRSLPHLPDRPLRDSAGGNPLEFSQPRSCDRGASVGSSVPSCRVLGGTLILRRWQQTPPRSDPRDGRDARLEGRCAEGRCPGACQRVRRQAGCAVPNSHSGAALAARQPNRTTRHRAPTPTHQS